VGPTGRCRRTARGNDHGSIDHLFGGIDDRELY
jgi:hypothetical protein